MSEWLNNFFNRIKKVFASLGFKEKAILSCLALVVFIASLYLVRVSSKGEDVLLYPKGLERSDFQRAVSKLDKLDIPYSTSENRFIYVNNEQEAIRARAQLGIEGSVRDVNGFELFNNPEFSMTDFERRVNLRRAITGNLVRHLEALDDIDQAEVSLSYGEGVQSIYRRDRESNPLTASVSLKLAPFSDLHENKKKIRGIRDFISKGVDRLLPENVLIVEQGSGFVLTDQLEIDESDANIARAREQLRIKEKIRLSKIKELRSLLSMFPPDRYQLSVDLDINWDVKNTVIQGIEPVILKNPNDKFDKGRVLDGVVVSEKEIQRQFDGPTYIPEGPAGVEPNVAPGAKELIDRFTKYRDNVKTKNKEIATKIQEKKNQPYQILGFNVAVVVDGIWTKVMNKSGELQLDKNGQIKREYVKINDEQVKSLHKLIQAAFSKKRGDTVVVRHFQFDRLNEFELENLKYHEEIKQERVVWISIASLVGIVFIIILFRFVRKEMLRRKRLKEEQIIREQKAMREAALLNAEDDGVVLDIPPEDRVRLEMQDNAINIARDNPEDVAHLLRSWMLDRS